MKPYQHVTAQESQDGPSRGQNNDQGRIFKEKHLPPSDAIKTCLHRKKPLERGVEGGLPKPAIPIYMHPHHDPDMTHTLSRPDLVACHDCDALHRANELSVGQAAFCRRCGSTLYRNPTLTLDAPLAFALAGLACFALAQSYPLLFLALAGRTQESTLLMGVTALLDENLWSLAILVFCTSILFPLLDMLTLVYLLVPLKILHRPWRQSARIFRLHLALKPWGMTGIYLLGLLVAIVKLRDLASVAPGIALYAFVGFLTASLASHVTLDTRTLWQHLENRP